MELKDALKALHFNVDRSLDPGIKWGTVLACGMGISGVDCLSAGGQQCVMFKPRFFYVPRISKKCKLLVNSQGRDL